MEQSTGHTIRAARLARGWTQKQLGEAAGVSVIAIKRLEADQHAPSTESARRLAHALGIPVNELLGEDDILAGPWPAATMQALGLDEAFLLRYAKLWPDLHREQRAWVVGHLRIMADAERKIRALEGRAPRGEPDSAPDAGSYLEIIPSRV